MFGWLKKRKTMASPPPLPEQFWDAMGIGRLVPAYIQLHLASRSPGHGLSRHPDGSVDTDDVPAFMHENDPQARASFLRLMSEQLDPSALPGLTPDEIVSRLCAIYTEVTGKEMYAAVCKAWCVQRKLV